MGHEVTLEQIPSGAQPQPVALEPGENQVPILPSSYISDLKIDGRPYYYNARLSGNKSFNIGQVVNNIVAGVEYRLYGNNGLGRIYDLSRPPVPTGGTDARPRSYKDIPSLGQLAYYAERTWKPLWKPGLTSGRYKVYQSSALWHFQICRREHDA